VGIGVVDMAFDAANEPCAHFLIPKKNWLRPSNIAAAKTAAQQI
jgi:hypothetical protein